MSQEPLEATEPIELHEADTAEDMPADDDPANVDYVGGPGE